MARNKRQSERKQGYDYSAQGNYFVTVCVRNREPLLGRIDGEEMLLSEMGMIVQEEWQVLPERFPTIHLDAFVMMPNHVHGIITIVGASLAGARPVDQSDGMDREHSESTRSGSSTVRAGARPAPTLGTIIGAFKSLSDRRCRKMFIAEHPDRRFGRLWQRNYHDHIIADGEELERIREYIDENVRNWETDPNYVPIGKQKNLNKKMHGTSCVGP